MPEEPQDNSQPDENIQTENTNPYIKQPQPIQPNTGYNPTPVTEQTVSEPTPDLPPTVANPFQQTNQVGVEPTKSSLPNWLKNKKLVIAISIAAAVLILGGGSALAYTTWYQNPNKVLADSLINALTTKQATYTGKLTYDVKSESSDVSIVVEIDSKLSDAGQQHHNAKLTMTYDSKAYSIEGDALFDKKGDLYFKVSGLKKVINDAKTSLGLPFDSEASTAIDNIVEKIDGVWVRVSTDDLNEINDSYSNVKKCVNEAVDKFKNDKAAISEVSELYRKNSFITIKKDLGQSNGNFVYELTNDIEAGKKFIIGLKDTKIYKDLNACDKSIVINESDVNTIDQDDGPTPAATTDPNTYKLSIGAWSHKITKFEVNGSTSSEYDSSATTTSFFVEPNYDKVVTIETPSKSISLSELKTYIDDLMESFGVSSRAQSAAASANANSVRSLAEVTYAESGHYPSSIAQFSQSEISELPSEINLVANPNLINSDNGYNTISWSCLNSCANPSGGRVGYFDYDTNSLSWYYVGDATEGDNFVNP